MKAILFNRGLYWDEYCIDKKMHVAPGRYVGPCDGSCEPKEAEMPGGLPTDVMMAHFLATGQSCSWDEHGDRGRGSITTDPQPEEVTDDQLEEATKEDLEPARPFPLRGHSHGRYRY